MIGKASSALNKQSSSLEKSFKCLHNLNTEDPDYKPKLKRAYLKIHKDLRRLEKAQGMSLGQALSRQDIKALDAKDYSRLKKELAHMFSGSPLQDEAGEKDRSSKPVLSFAETLPIQAINLSEAEIEDLEESISKIDELEGQPKLASQAIADFFKDKGPLSFLGRAVEVLSNPENSFRKMLGSYANSATLAINVFAGAMGEKHPITKKIADMAYRGFIFMNGALTTLTGLAKNRGLFTLGHAMDMAIAFAPLDKMYLFRGFSTGLYNLDNNLHKSSSEAPNGAYKSIWHSIQVSFNRMTGFAKELSQDIQRISSNPKLNLKEKIKTFSKESLMNTDKATVGILGGTSSFIGAFLNLTGFEKAGKVFRDLLGAIAVDAERFNPKNLKNGQLFYWMAGVLFSGGTISDTLHQTRAQIIFDSLAKIFATEMNRRGELDKNVKNDPIPLPNKDPKGFVKAVLTAVKDMFTIHSKEKSNELDSELTLDAKSQDLESGLESILKNTLEKSAKQSQKLSPSSKTHKAYLVDVRESNTCERGQPSKTVIVSKTETPFVSSKSAEVEIKTEIVKPSSNARNILEARMGMDGRDNSSYFAMQVDDHRDVFDKNIERDIVTNQIDQKDTEPVIENHSIIDSHSHDDAQNHESNESETPVEEPIREEPL